MSEIIPFSALQRSDNNWEFEGSKFGNTEITFIIVNADPGTGPRLHSHPYTEIIIILEGNSIVTVDDETIEATGAKIVLISPNTPHKFVNVGSDRLRQVDIHLNPKFITTWLE